VSFIFCRHGGRHHRLSLPNGRSSILLSLLLEFLNNHVPAPVFNTLREWFTEEQIVRLTWAVIAINSWNRLMITFTVPPAEEK
jgi:hypothetical protein